MWQAVGLIVAVVAVLALRGRAVAASGGSVMSGSSNERRALVELTGRELELPDAWIVWLVWVAKGESNWHLTAHNKSSGEKAAAGKAYDRLVEQGRWTCPQVRSDYAIGSGGWYGQLAPLTVLFARELGAESCDPIAFWLNPTTSTRAHLRHVRGTINKYLSQLPPSNRTFLHLRALYGLPSRIANPGAIDNPERRQKYGATLKSAGIDPSFLDVIVPELPEGF